MGVHGGVVAMVGGAQAVGKSLILGCLVADVRRGGVEGVAREVVSVGARWIWCRQPELDIFCWQTELDPARQW